MHGSDQRQRISPIRVAVASLRFGGTLIGLVPGLLRQARVPDPMTLEPRILHSGAQREDR